MNIDLIRERAFIFGATILGIFLAIYCGQMVANDNLGRVALIFLGIAVIGVALTVRELIWFTIPMFWHLNGRMEVLPLPFSWKDLGVMITCGIAVVLVALRVMRTKPKWGLLDLFLLINVLWLLFTYIRNPAGTLATNSDRIGGRAYFDCLITLGAYVVLSRSSANVKWLRRMPLIVYGVVAVFFLLNVLLIYVPQLTGVVSQFYSGFDLGQVAFGQPNFEVADAEFQRYAFFKDIGNYGVLILCSYFVPSTLLSPLNFFRFAAFGLLMFGLLLSGFRSFIMYAGAMVVLGNYFHRGVGSAVKTVLLGFAMALLLLLGHGMLYTLPLSAQRALAFIPEAIRPSKLERSAIEAGSVSTEWRVEMWKDALFTNRYITDKTIGDGFGVTRQQASEASRMIMLGNDKYRTMQHAAAMYGDFHSGPVTTIRVSGYIGLGLMTLSLIFTAVRAARMIQSAKGTPLFSPALYVGLPLVFEPFWFFFIFGHYMTAFIAICLGLGYIKMIENSLERWRAEDGNAGTSEATLESVPEREALPELETTPALRA